MESVNAKICASQNNFMVCKTNPGPGAGDIVNSSSRADDATDSDQLTLNAYTPTIDEGWTECESWRRPRHGTSAGTTHTASFRWQADRWPGATSRSGGTSVRQRSVACGQRG